MEPDKTNNYEDAKYRIFEHFSNEHNVLLLESEILEIARLCEPLTEALKVAHNCEPPTE